MAEAIAAFYAVETAVEGAALGAYVASRPTVPLHVRFRKLKAPAGGGGGAPSDNNAWGPVVGHTVNVIKGKAYIFGGDTANGVEHGADVKVVTLPSSLDSAELDFQIIPPQAAQERPLQAYSTEAQVSSTMDSSNQIPEPRADHSSASIDADIFVLGGRVPRALDNTCEPDKVTATTTPFPLDTIHCFSTQRSSWTTIRVDTSACEDGIPAPRTSASCTSTTHPEPGSGIEVTTTAHGTIFLHGGYDSNGQPLRDTWSFDVSSRSWTRWPDIPDPSPHEVAGQGNIVYQHNDQCICRVGDGFGKVMFMPVQVAHGNVVTATSGPHVNELALKPESNEWDVVTFGGSSDGGDENGGEKPPMPQSESVPLPRKNAGFVPITTGAGRLYHLYFMGQDGPGSLLNDVWSLQVKPLENSGAAVKDKLRTVAGRSTGENQWALCEVVESTKTDGPLDLPRGMTGFAADAWTDLGGGHVLIWGGRMSDGSIEDGGWVLTAE